MASRTTSDRLLLIGGGHSHVEVLRRFARHGPPRGLSVTVVSRDMRTAYSGMLPGLIAGRYVPDEIHIDLAPLCAAAGARLVADTVDELDMGTGRAASAGGRTFAFDYLSLNAGCAPVAPGSGSEFVIPVKPIGRFVTHFDRLLDRLSDPGRKQFELAVVGGGAGGVELALAISARSLRCSGVLAPQITVYESGDRILPGYPRRARQRLRRAMRDRGIEIRTCARIERVTEKAVVTESGRHHTADAVLWVTAAAAPDWLAESGLALDAAGFVAVNAHLQSVSHPNVFATGDIASMQGVDAPKAGVYAVRQAPVLARNLRRIANGESLVRFRPQKRYLSLISTGDGAAVAARGWFVAEGAWVWSWKDWIDRRFVRRYRPEKL